MSESLTNLKRVPHSILQERLEEVKKLIQSDLESYEVLKDKMTGEHYLLYTYDHLVIADNHKETYYHFMPLETDDVLAIVLGEQDYAYPENWTRPFLRSSSEDDSYVWFDPSSEFEYDEQTGLKLKQMLSEFKQKGTLDRGTMEKLFRDLDKL